MSLFYIPVGDILIDNKGRNYEVVSSGNVSCQECTLLGTKKCHIVACTPESREDGNYVIFIHRKDFETMKTKEKE